MDAVNQWMGDMMILQMLCDSENVNEQEREVLQRWILAAEKPEDATPEPPAAAETVDPSAWLAQTEKLVAELQAEMRAVRAKGDGHIDCIRGTVGKPNLRG